MRYSFHHLAEALSLCLLTASSLSGQASFVNFETQAIKPMTLARVAGHDYLLVCNTPDNSVEIYDCHDHRLLQRVPTGLGPVTIVWNRFLSQFYTCNHDGDSVSSYFLEAPNGQHPDPKAILNATEPVGDEPTDIAFLPDQLTYFVTQESRSAFGWYDSFLTKPIGGPAFGARINLTRPLFAANAARAIKSPRRVLVAPDASFLIFMGARGGNTNLSNTYDFDLLTLDFTRGIQTEVGGLGTTNFNLELGADTRLYVVGTEANNHLVGEAAVAAAPTGFVESHLYVLTDPTAAQPQIETRDLNLDHMGQVVGKANALTTPTDVATIPAGTAVQKVFVTAFSSDKIGILDNNGGAPSTWPIRRIAIPNLRSTEGYTRVGPRAFALKQSSGLAGDPGQLLYCFNGLNQTVTIVDPQSETIVGAIRLANDPTPQEVIAGRGFLYSADVSSNGFGACSSCHIDGRSDGMLWNLGTPGGGLGPNIDPLLGDGLVGLVPTQYEEDKGPMMTTSLQGLVNHPSTGSAGYLLTSAPYHWRGDRSSFEDFNSAYVSLLGAPNIGTPSAPLGIPAIFMTSFRIFVDSIMYPPNPEQPHDRRYSGSFGTSATLSGSGAQRGMKAYHTWRLPSGTVGGRSCSQCHALPDGSNNLLTLSDALPGFLLQPVETAQLRGGFQREARLELSATTQSSTVTAEFGMLRTGPIQLSINSFLSGFAPAFPGQTITLLPDIIRFSREMDWGVAPVIGQTKTVAILNRNAAETTQKIQLFEQQALEANAGLAVTAYLNGVYQGYVYDVTVTPASYRRVGTASLLTRAQVLALLAANTDRLVFAATPVGSAARIASPTGKAIVRFGQFPANIKLEPMRATSCWRGISQLTDNILPGNGPTNFLWDGKDHINNLAPEPLSMKAMRIYQRALSMKAPGFGITRLQHDPPRRFRVSGDFIRHGATLTLSFSALAGQAPPLAPGAKRHDLTMTLFPTDEVNGQGKRIWETSAELDPLNQYVLLLGGPFAPDVAAARAGSISEIPPPSAFSPLLWNQYGVRVTNADGTFADGGWQALRVQ